MKIIHKNQTYLPPKYQGINNNNISASFKFVKLSILLPLFFQVQVRLYGKDDYSFLWYIWSGSRINNHSLPIKVWSPIL